jgi:hypothetical protein
MRMMRIVCAVAALSLWPSPLLAKPPKDVFVRAAQLKPGDRDGRLMLDARFGRPGALARLRAALMDKKASKALREQGWPFLCQHLYIIGRYKDAISVCRRAIVDAPQSAKADRDALTLAEILAVAPPLSLEGRGARVPVAKSGRIAVAAGPWLGTAVPDTGAEIGVMMASVARAAHVRVLGSSGHVATTTTAVAGGIGVIPQVTIGASTLRNLPVLVLPDAQLTFDKGKFTLPFILGLQALRAFGRVAWLDHATVLALGDAAPALASQSVPVFWHPAGIGLPLDGPRGRRAAHFDMGAGNSYLFMPALAIVSKKERARMQIATRKIGGVGGVVTQKIHRLPVATFRLAGRTLVFKRIDVAPPVKSGEAARIGLDAVKRFATVVLDFRAMRLSAR